MHKYILLTLYNKQMKSRQYGNVLMGDGMEKSGGGGGFMWEQSNNVLANSRTVNDIVDDPIQFTAIEKPYQSGMHNSEDSSVGQRS